ncbi:MAG: glpE [bacterium]|nr:glpE [bacterium]
MDHSKEFQALVDDAKSRIAECTIDDVLARQKRGDKLRLIDVREDDEWRAGHVRGAEHLGRGVLERDIVGKAPDKNEELILYCGGGFRSALAADNLVRMGYKRVFSLAGGWRAWNERGLPTEK